MMTEIGILIAARSAERLTVVLFAGISVILGWNLFRAGIVDEQSAEFSMKDLRVRFSRVAPGVFFALFGMSALVYAIARPLDIRLPQEATARQERQSPGQSEYSVSYGAGTTENDLTHVQAINTLASVCGTSTGTPTTTDASAKERALEILNRVKRQTLVSHFGHDFDWYSQLKDAALSDPSRVAGLTAAQRKRFQEIDDAATSILK